VKKNKNMIMIGGAVVVVVVAGFLLLSRKGGLGNNLVQNAVQGGPFSGSLKAAVALGVPMRCSYTVDGNEYSGVIKGNQYRGSVKSQNGKGTVIMKDNCIYTWGEGETQGFKSCFDPEETDVWEQSNETLPINYNCNPAAVTDAEFNLPQGVNFMSMEEMMENAGVEMMGQ